MKYSIVFSSHTGNTRLLAETLKDNLPEDECIYYGVPDEKALDAELIFVGFWTDKGMCDDLLSDFLRKLHNKKVFLFGTAGFGNSKDYFTQILTRVQNLMTSSNQVVGRFMCQGKMQSSVRERYTAMLSQNPEKFQALIENFDTALSHPDSNDLDKLYQQSIQIIQKWMSLDMI